MNNLAPRFRESAFRNYEPYIRVVVERWPQLSIFTMKTVGKSSVTFTCRLRDAMRSLRDNHWSTFVPDTFYDVYPSIVVSDRGSEVWVGDADALKVKAQAAVLDNQQGKAQVKRLGVRSVDQLDKLLSLVNEGVIAGPVEVQTTWGMSRDALISFQDAYPNIFITLDNNVLTVI